MNNPNRVSLLKAVSVTVNEFYFSPSKVKKGAARKAIKELAEFVEAVELPKPKATKPKAVQQSQGTDEMMELFQKFLATQGMMPDPPKVEATKPKATKPKATKPKATKPNRRRVTKKATPTQRVADHQERAFHGRADGPITPSKQKHTASVEEARKSAEAVSKANGATARIEAKAKAQKEEVLRAFQAKLDLEFPLDGTSNELSFSDLSLRELAQMM